MTTKESIKRWTKVWWSLLWVKGRSDSQIGRRNIYQCTDNLNGQISGYSPTLDKNLITSLSREWTTGHAHCFHAVEEIVIPYSRNNQNLLQFSVKFNCFEILSKTLIWILFRSILIKHASGTFQRKHWHTALLPFNPKLVQQLACHLTCKLTVRAGLTKNLCHPLEASKSA